MSIVSINSDDRRLISMIIFRAAMESHPIQVLRYAAKHDHQRTMEEACAIGIKKDPWAVLNCGLTYGIKKLINTAAEAALCTAIEDVPDVLDPTRLGAWVRFPLVETVAIVGLPRCR